MQSIQPPAIYQLINQERAKAKLPPLKMDDGLSKAAMDKANDMINKGYFAHANPQGQRGYDFIKINKIGYNSAGENLADGFNSSDAVVKAWMNSPTHKANIMNGKFSNMGLAVMPTVVNGKKTTYVVQLFTEPFAQKKTVIGQPKMTAQAQTVTKTTLGKGPSQMLTRQPVNLKSMMSKYLIGK